MSHTFVIFGASGDLTSRKLIPALYQLFRKKRLPKNTRIVGNSRTAFTHEEFRASLAGPGKEFAEKEYSEESWNAFSQLIFYQAGDASKDEDFAKLAAFLKELEGEGGADRTYYLSTAPFLYEPITLMLGKHNMNRDPNRSRRIVIEKPFGVDLASAQHLNRVVHSVFQEK
ncbi:MAG TPA: glucose-6-phosphate dehydrogenase, partial [Pirellulales bacterium]